jgi:hypothetical protein
VLGIIILLPIRDQANFCQAYRRTYQLVGNMMESDRDR